MICVCCLLLFYRYQYIFVEDNAVLGNHAVRIPRRIDIGKMNSICLIIVFKYNVIPTNPKNN